MPTLAIGRLHEVKFGPELVAYLERIDATLEPFDGRFVVHGAQAEVLEGRWSGDLVIIEFPDRRRAHGWYDSAAYQDILPLRTRNAASDVILIDTAAADHRATDILPAIAP